MKKTEKVVNDVKSIALVDTLRKRLDRDEIRYKNKRCVYMYRSRVDHSYRDNLLLLDYSTRLAHKDFFSKTIYSLICGEFKDIPLSKLNDELSESLFAYVDIVYVGTFDKLRFKFSKLRKPITLLNCDELIDMYLNEREKNEKVSH